MDADPGPMRLSDLSRRSGVPAPTVKFYLREGLLPPGRATARNQALYDETHLTRLRLIRALTAIGRLPLATVGDVLAGLDACTRTAGVATGRSSAADLVSELGWRLPDGSDAEPVEHLGQVLAALRRLGWDGDLDPWAAAAEQVARRERAATEQLPPAGAAAYAVLSELTLTALHDLAKRQPEHDGPAR